MLNSVSAFATLGRNKDLPPPVASLVLKYNRGPSRYRSSLPVGIVQVETETPYTSNTQMKVLPERHGLAKGKVKPSKGRRECDATGKEGLLSTGWAE